MAYIDEEHRRNCTYLGVITKPCQQCGNPVEVSPQNASWISNVMSLTNIEFTLVAPCHSCGCINYYIYFMKKTALKKSDGVIEV